MQDIIHELTAIDTDAQKITGNALAKRQNAGRIVAGRTAVIRERYKKEADAKCAEFEKTARENAEKSIAALREKNRAAEAAMETAYRAHSGEWIAAAYKGITGSAPISDIADKAASHSGTASGGTANTGNSRGGAASGGTAGGERK